MSNVKETYHRAQLRQMRAGEGPGAETEMDFEVCVYEGHGPRVQASVTVTTTKPQKGREQSEPLKVHLQGWEQIRDLGLKLMETGLKMRIADERLVDAERDQMYKMLMRTKYEGWCTCGAKPGTCSADPRTPGHAKITKNGPAVPWTDSDDRQDR